MIKNIRTLQKGGGAAKVNEQSMVLFVKNLGSDMILLEPQRLVNQVKDEMESPIQMYEKIKGAKIRWK